MGQRLSKVASLRGAEIPPTTSDDHKRLLNILKLEDDLPFLIGRVLAITLAGRIGLVPKGARPDDEIVVMPGGAVPLVLRKYARVLLCHERSPYYLLICEW